MPKDVLVPAAQYIRMSTEHQQFSLDSQHVAIQAYADSRGFSVGPNLRRRQLLQDVVSGDTGYTANRIVTFRFTLQQLRELEVVTSAR